MNLQGQDDSYFEIDSKQNAIHMQNQKHDEYDAANNSILKLNKIKEEESFLANEKNASSNSGNSSTTTDLILNALNSKNPLSTFTQQQQQHPTPQSSSSSSTSSFNKFSNDTSLNSIKSSILASNNRENDPNLLCSPSSSLLLLSSSPLLILNQTTTLTTTNVTSTGSSSSSSSSTSNTIDDVDIDNADKVSFKSSSIASSISNRQKGNDKCKQTQITNLYPLIDEPTHPNFHHKNNKDLNVNTYLEKFERIYNNFDSLIDDSDMKRKPNYIQNNNFSSSSIYTSSSSSTSSNFNRKIKNSSSNQIQTFSYV